MQQLDTPVKILVIDDEEANVRALSMSLRGDGYEVYPACSGPEGVDAFKSHRPDLVLTDIKMPGMDGIEVLKKIKAMDADVEVIIITGHGDVNNAVEALKFGASDFINKPVRDEALAVAIARAREKRAIRGQLREYTDTLEHKVAEATRELRRQSDFLAHLIRSSHESIIATDRELTVVVFNPVAERIFGYHREEVVQQKKITELLPAVTLPLFAGDPHDVRAPMKLSLAEIDLTARDGSKIPVSFHGTTLHDQRSLLGTVCFLEDLREIKRLKAELLQAERLAAIGQTVAGVAHGIKNILHGFKGGSYLVNIGIERNDREKLEKGWRIVQRNIGRTSELVMDLLSYAKERAAELKHCQPNAIAQDVCDLLRPLAEQNQVTLTLETDPNLGTVWIDPHSLHQSLSNLVSNAIDACLLDEAADKTWQVEVSTARESDRQLRISVSDNGMGMDAEVKARLFTAFFSTKGHRGTGLGLLVTRKLIEEHGGSIEVTSRKGRGTTVTFWLPCRENEGNGNGIFEKTDL
jgi:PAS domain S-box-containing protein